MTENSLDDSPTAYPFMHYEDAPAAIDWLERAFGFSRHYVVPAPTGRSPTPRFASAAT